MADIGERTTLDRAIDRAADAGRVMLALGGAVVLFTVVFGSLQYRHVYGTFRPLVRLPPRFHACGESTYLRSRPGPHHLEFIASSTIPIGHTPGATIYASTTCATPGCPTRGPDRCGVPTVLVVRHGRDAHVYALSGGT